MSRLSKSHSHVEVEPTPDPVEAPEESPQASTSAKPADSGDGDPVDDTADLGGGSEEHDVWSEDAQGDIAAAAPVTVAAEPGAASNPHKKGKAR